jgi:triphosphoribosyl-dephospho-CoA synthase
MPNDHSPGMLAQVACLLEVTARKPGNVHRFRDFSDTHFLHYGLSALAIGQALDRARAEGVGVAVLAAVRATRMLVATNTNLGMILLLAPLAAVPEGTSLATGIEAILQSTTIDDARRVFEAVRLAKPGGLGSAPEQDVSTEPTVTLRDAMALASGRDAVARQYVNGFADVLDRALPHLARLLRAGGAL